VIDATNIHASLPPATPDVVAIVVLRYAARRE
jgi:hypothetical protein